MADPSETVTLTIDGDDATDELTVPVALVDLLAEGDQSAPEVVGDVALFGMAQRIHATVHHSQEEPGEDLQELEEVTTDLFEERFGMTYGEATGHSH
ncbi:hypothetical protein BRC81_03450 [Halobacteriales archaeon QS_1_68_20]|nr:MAG: hypothetical protein BRC81_03450 [Halobacteriales archaeon QS_1_68_20]